MKKEKEIDNEVFEGFLFKYVNEINEIVEKKLKEQQKKIIKIIDELIRVRKKSIGHSISDYEEIFSINDLNSIKQKLKKEIK